MTVTPDITSDFETYVDNLESITLAIKGVVDPVAIATAHRKQIHKTESTPAGGDVVAGDVVFEFPVADSAAVVPIGSTITDSDATVWTIIGIDKQVWASKWHATCRDLAVYAGLDTLVTVQTATYTKSNEGVQVPTWANTYENVRAKVQPIREVVDDEWGADRVKDNDYAITLESDLAIEIGANVRVKDANGKYYRPTSYEQPSRIDALPVLLCQKVA